MNLPLVLKLFFFSFWDYIILQTLYVLEPWLQRISQWWDLGLSFPYSLHKTLANFGLAREIILATNFFWELPQYWKVFFYTNIEKNLKGDKINSLIYEKPVGLSRSFSIIRWTLDEALAMCAIFNLVESYFLTNKFKIIDDGNHPSILKCPQ